MTSDIIEPFRNCAVPSSASMDSYRNTSDAAFAAASGAPSFFHAAATMRGNEQRMLLALVRRLCAAAGGTTNATPATSAAIITRFITLPTLMVTFGMQGPQMPDRDPTANGQGPGLASSHLCLAQPLALRPQALSSIRSSRRRHQVLARLLQRRVVH